jgi:hypothetical protein
MPYKPANPVPKPRLAILDDPAIAAARVVSPAEAGQILQSGTTRINQLIQSGALRSYMDGSLRKVFLESIFAYQASLAARASQAPRASQSRVEPPKPEPPPRPKGERRNRARASLLGASGGASRA